MEFIRPTSSKNLIVALINVVMEGDYQYEQEIPLGLAYIGAFLRKHGYNVIFKQCLAGRGQTELNLVTEMKANVYGFQLNTVNYLAVKSVVKKIKSKWPNAITMFGGPFLISLSEVILRNEPLFDFIVMGEGEETVLKLIQAIELNENDFSQIDGLVWRNKLKEIIKNQYRGLVKDLDTLPFPIRDFLENGQRDPVDNGLIESVRVISSRGCVARCSFCSVNFYSKVQKGKIWRGRSPKNIVDELEYLNKKYNAMLFNFSDSSFEDPGRYGKDRTREICEEIIRRGLHISIKIYLRSETMKTQNDIELLKLYKMAGIDVIIIGAESGSDDELRFYEKKATVEDNYRTAMILKELDLFYVTTGIIMFGPNSTMESIRSNIEYMYKFGFADNLIIVANILMLIRDSKLYTVLKEEGRVVESGNYWELPKYVMKDSSAERLSKHWQNIFARFPLIRKVNELQINIGNLISRMINPRNAKVLTEFKNEYVELKHNYTILTQEFGKLQYDYFIYTMDLIKNGCSDEKLISCNHDFFERIYGSYFPIYKNLYNNFLDKIVERRFSLSGLIFKQFSSAMVISETERIYRRG